MLPRLDRQLEGAELEYAKGVILHHYNNGQLFDYYLIGNLCLVGAGLTGILIKMVKMLFTDFSIGLLLTIIFIGAFAAFIWWLNFILIFQSNRKERNEKIFANELTAYDVTLEKVTHGSRPGSYFAKARFIDGSTPKYEIPCRYYGTRSYRKGLIIKIMGPRDKLLGFDLIPAYIPGSKVDRIAKKELRKKKYVKYRLQNTET